MEENKTSASKKWWFWLVGVIIAVVVVAIMAIVATQQPSDNWDPIITEAEMKQLCQVEAMPLIEEAFAGDDYIVINPEKEAVQLYIENDGMSRYDTPIARLGWFGKNNESGKDITFACLASKNQKGEKEILTLFAGDETNQTEITGNILTAYSTKDEEGNTAVSEDWMVRTCQKDYKNKIDALLPGTDYEFINTKERPRLYAVSEKYQSPYGSPVVSLTWYGYNKTDNKEMRFICYAAKISKGEDKLFYLSFSNGLYESKDVYGTMRDAFSDESWAELGK